MFYLHGTCLFVGRMSYLVLQAQSSRRSGDGAAQHRSTVDASELQQAPALKPLKINKNNFAGLEAQGEGAILSMWHHFPLHAATPSTSCVSLCVCGYLCVYYPVTHCWRNVNKCLKSMFQISPSLGAFLDGWQYSAAAFASAASQSVAQQLVAAAGVYAFQPCTLRNDSAAEGAKPRQAEWGCARGSYPSHENGS